MNYGVNVFGISSDKKPYEIAELAIQKTEEVFEKGAETVDAGPWNYGRKPL